MTGTFSGLLDGQLRGLGELIHEGRERPMMVWRIQRKSGQGPYRGAQRFDIDPKNPDLPSTDRALYRFIMSGDKFGGKDKYLAASSMMDVKNFVASALNPGPSTDFEVREWAALPEKTKAQYVFGFPTKRSIIDWVGTRRLKGLAAEGYELVEVPARRVIISKSGRQVLFIPWSKRYVPPPSNYMARYRAEMASKRQPKPVKLSKWRDRR